MALPDVTPVNTAMALPDVTPANTAVALPDVSPANTATPMFECIICADEKSEDQKALIQGDALCKDCYKKRFEEAIRHESQWPFRWGSQIVYPDPEILGNDFVAMYAFREDEYQTLPGHRLYCNNRIPASTTSDDFASFSQPLALDPCGLFDAEARSDSMPCGAFMFSTKDYPDHLPAVAHCNRCCGFVCRHCGSAVARESESSHECPDPEGSPPEADRFAGQVRGEHYQLCPASGCGVPVELKEACNFMRCPIAICSTGFCFCCGEEISHDGDHFRPGKPCPRFGSPGDSRAVYDDPPVDRALLLERRLYLREWIELLAWRIASLKEEHTQGRRLRRTASEEERAVIDETEWRLLTQIVALEEDWRTLMGIDAMIDEDMGLEDEEMGDEAQGEEEAPAEQGEQ